MPSSPSVRCRRSSSISIAWRPIRASRQSRGPPMPRSWCACALTWRIAAATSSCFCLMTIEPIREVLLQMFMGEKFGRDPIWEGHLATEIGQAEIAVDAVLYEAQLPLRQLMKLSVGDTLTLELKPDAFVTVRCGDVTLTEGRMGRVGDRVAGRIAKPLRKPTTTFAMFETADASSNRVEA